MPATYNERSWAIDLIAHLNRITTSQRLNVRSAGGERTIRDEDGHLFPDVLLFGDKAGRTILQGWELKMPDTPVTNTDLLENAKRKARGLGLNSFLVWNVDRAVLHAADDTGYRSKKHWTLPGGPAAERSNVTARRDDWQTMAETILQDVDRLFDEGVLRERILVDAFSDRTLIEAFFKNVPATVERLQEAMRRDNRFEAEVNLWWSEVKKEHSETDKLPVLARRALTGWLGKFVFAHVLKSACADARSIENLAQDSSPADAAATFRDISQTCNFLNIFRDQLGEGQIADRAWSHLAQINDFFSELDVDAIGPETTQVLLQNTVSAAKRKAAGQFTTPPALAHLLVRVVARDKTGVILDPCCGTGTIPAAAYDEKRNAGQPASDALRSVWASDKFAFPLQAATLALARPDHMGELLHIFQQDVVDLEIGTPLTFHDPDSGKETQKTLPAADCIASNLPFVQFEDVEDKNPTIKRINERIEALTGEEVSLPGRSDLYAYLPFHLWTLLDDGGRAGLVLSNAWLGTDWGRKFRRLLQRFYYVEKVVVSGRGRWFQNADVVTSLVFLEKRNEVGVPDETEQTAFVTTKKALGELKNEGDFDDLASRVILNRDELDWTTAQTHTSQEIERFEGVGIEWSGLFADVGWLREVESKLIPVSDLFEIGRGERRGWNALFYPSEGHGIEDEYIERCLKNPARAEGLVAETDIEAFSCSRSIAELKRRGDQGALAWIQKFEHETNTIGTPLPDVLAKPGLHWYEMSTSSMADLVLPVNPYERLFIPSLRERSFVDQRFTRFTLRNDSHDAHLCHALMNSLIALFCIEALGFGRGLGALDLSTTRAKRQLHMLDPAQLGDQQKQDVLGAFAPLLNRSVEPLPHELERDDRKAFDQTVLKAFGLGDLEGEIRGALRQLFEIRMAVND